MLINNSLTISNIYEAHLLFRYASLSVILQISVPLVLESCVAVKRTMKILEFLYLITMLGHELIATLLLWLLISDRRTFLE